MNEGNAPNSGAIGSRADRTLRLALDIGEGLLKNGDSVHHVEETVRRICEAYGGEHIEVFVISSLVLASVYMDDGTYSSQIRRVYGSENNMSALEELNRLSRKLCTETPDFDDASRLYAEMKQRRAYPKWLSLGGSILSAGSFAVFFGGSIRDGIAGAIVGLILGLLSQIRIEHVNALAKTLILSFIAGVASYLTVLVGIGRNVDMIMIGSIMLLIPGLAFGNALRDLLGGDILTGILKTVQSCLTALLIACGFSGAMLALTPLGIQSGIPAHDHGFVAALVMAILGTAAFSCVFKVKCEKLILTAIAGGSVYAVFCLCESLGAPSFAAAFFCAVFGTAFSEICARILRAPAIVFLTPAIIPIVPGGSLYYTMSALIGKNTDLLLEKGSQTLYVSAGLVVGMMLVTMVIPFFTSARNPKTES